ncbi:MAG: heavy metal-binding domain-containing protein, partial [Cyanobacteria bacterium P01_A01_bin.17]
FLASLSKLVGGQIFAYESLLDRGRREALLRMKEDAIRWGAKKVINVRLETATIGSRSGDSGILSIEIVAYGTGLR